MRAACSDLQRFVRDMALIMDNFTQGWSEQAHFLRDELLEGARDAYLLRVQASHVVEEWEDLPLLTKRGRAPHRYNHYRTHSVQPVSKHADVSSASSSGFVAQTCQQMSNL